MNNLILRRILSVILLFALTAAQLPLAYAVDEGLTISLNADGLEEGAYDALIDDEISFSYNDKSYTIDQTYRISVTFGTEISFLNATGESMMANRHFYLDGSVRKTGWPKNKTKTLDDLSGAVATEEMLKQAGFVEGSFESGCKSYYFFAFHYKEIRYGVLLQVKADSEGITEEDKVPLQQLVASVTGDNEANWHQTNDRYNGNDADTITDQKSGFWAELTAQNGPLAQAQAALDNPGSIQELSDAASALQAAINKLIPTTQVNATRLYEAVQAYQKLKESDYTAASWAEGELLYGKMVTLLDSLYDGSGNPTADNTSDKQSEADALVDQIYNGHISDKYNWKYMVLVNQLNYNEYKATYDARRQEAENLLTQYDPQRLTETDYTRDTWSAYTAAYDLLKEDMEHRFAGGTLADYKMLSLFEKHLDGLIAARLKLASSGDVTCSFTYVNNMLSRYPNFRQGGTALYENPSMTLAAGSTTVSKALEQARITYNRGSDGSLPAGLNNPSDMDPLLAVYLNGEWVGSAYVEDLAKTDIQIPNNAEVLVMRYALPAEKTEASTGETTSQWTTDTAGSTAVYSDSFAKIGIKLGQTAEVKVGDKVTVTGSVTSAAYGKQNADLGGAGLTLFVSEPGETDALSAPIKETTAVTGADGSLEYVFTRPGWYTVALFDLTEDVITATDIFWETTTGTYYSLRTGGYTRIYVAAAEDDAALLAQYKTEKAAEAETFFRQYHDYDFAAGYYVKTFAPLYETLKANLEGATTFPDLMDRYEVDYAALRDAASAALNHSALLEELRADLALIPSDLSAMDETYQVLVTKIQTTYTALNDHQKNLLTAHERERLAGISQLDAAQLRKLANVTVTFQKPGETEYPFATMDGTMSGTGGAALYSWPNLNWISHRQPNGIIPDPDWKDPRQYADSLPAKSGDYVYVRFFLNQTEEQYRLTWSADDEKTWNLFEPAAYGGVNGYCLATWQVPEDAPEGANYRIRLKMLSRTEYENFVLNGDTEGLAENKAAAIAALESAMRDYRKDGSLGVEQLTAIQNAMEGGKAAIEAAGSNTEVADARKAALSAMAIAAGGATDVGNEGYDSGKTVGRVHVTMENTTYAGGAFYGPNSIADGWYTLGENDSMMTVVLKVLASKGYTWTGTGGTTANGYDITYLASVSKDGETLAEKQGGTAAGWMGTLNDWFTNLGFHAFTYKNGKLEDGDEIHIMFSLNAGEDLGGTWNNNDTRLKVLDISHGTLAPRFSGDVTDYLLVIPDGYTAIQVKPTAVNKNFQTRIFLNSYDKDNARYKSGETLTVRSGDVLYVGVGEKGWPTMNTGNRGTRYTIRVKTLADAIASLPQDSEVTQGNYKVHGQTAEMLQALVTTGNYAGDTTKLKNLRARVSFFEEIDTVKNLIGALPSLADIQASPTTYKDAVDRANTAYTRLSQAQQAYLVSADVKKLADAVKAVGAGQGSTDLEAVHAFNDKVTAIGNSVTAASEETIREARTAYDNLTAEQKTLVAERYNTLCNAEAALAVVQKIDSIGEVTLDKADEIAAARAAYDAYAGKFSTQNMVSNLDVLEAAEAALKILQGGGQDTSGYKTALTDVLARLKQDVPNPIVGSTNGEWAVLAQARADKLSENANLNYRSNLKDYVARCNGVLDTSENGTLHTEYARVVLALTSLGVDATRFEASNQKTYDLVKPLLDRSNGKYAYQVSEQGNNGTIWALIALDSNNYYRDEEGNKARAAWIDLLIDKQQTDGNWPIYNPDQVAGSGSELGGVDVCAMAVQALAPYYRDESKFTSLGAKHSHAALTESVNRAVKFMSGNQNSTGGYGNSEASAQVIVALAALGRDAGSDKDFTKSGISVLADLLRYKTSNGGFSHDVGQINNQMSTEQAAYALVAYDRYKNNKNSLYNMSDAFTSKPVSTHTITATAGTGGHIDPSGTITVQHGADQSFTITPENGYQIKDILVDGISEWAGRVFTAPGMEQPQTQLPAAPGKDETQETCADGIHVGENIVFGRRAATCTDSGYSGDVICGACGEVLEQGAEIGLAAHQYGSVWQSDETGHWQVCQVCGAHGSVESHLFEQAEKPAEQPREETELEETSPGEEIVDGAVGTDELPATDGSVPPEPTETMDTDGQPSENGSDAGAELVSLVGISPEFLLGVGAAPAQAAIPETHTEEQVCQVCGYHPTAEITPVCSHHGGRATCTALAVCEDCGQHYGDHAEHSFTELAYSSEMHWNVCAACGLEDISSLASHNWVLDQDTSTEAARTYVCADCGAERTETTFAAPATNTMVTSADSRAYPYIIKNITADHTIAVTFEKVSPVIRQEVTTSGNTQTAVIDQNAVTEAVTAAAASGADVITIIPTSIDEQIPSVSVELPAGAAQTIAEAKTGVVIQTTRGTVALPATVLSSIASEAGNDEKLTIHVEKRDSRDLAALVPNGTNLSGSAAIEVTVKAGDRELTSFGGHALTVTIPVDDSFIPGKTYDVLVVSGNGSHERLSGTCVRSGSGWSVRVSASNPGIFVVLAETVKQFTITATAGYGGEIDPSGYVMADAGKDKTFYITPAKGQKIESISVDGYRVDLERLHIYPDGSTAYTFRNVSEDHSIRATFKRGVEIPDFGPVVGEVYISIENTTYRNGDFTGTLVSGWYDLCARDTMMTSVLKALALDGYSWWGTGSGDSGGYGITYLAGIYVDENENGRRDNSEPSLAEFDGSRGAGWMGTLNDWFVNEGFQSFRAGGRGDYELASGDYLNIVFTQNLGEDVGSIWGNSDTSLDDLDISGGTLIPRFDGDTLEYTLSIAGSSARVTVTPSAVNKNYQVRTFLNYYNRDSARYKRTESITVKPGDVIYIGVGDPSWPSMNKQSSDAIRYEGTKYTITVTNGSSVEEVIKMLKALPEITYKNYKSQAAKVEAARSAYEALTTKAKKEIDRSLLNRLEAAEEKVKFYEEIDAVKDRLNKLPAVNENQTPSNRLIRQVKDAAAAYLKLDEAQREYITVKDTGNYEALRQWLVKKGAVKKNELPIIVGSLIMPEELVQLPFTDVSEADWFYDAVVYAYTNELFNGTSATTFSPNAPMNRAMLVTVLWRVEGSPVTTGISPFKDVVTGTWYSDAVRWANSAGIVTGVSHTTFDPEGLVTREQLATILYRYAKIKGWDISGASALTAFKDGSQTSEWAGRAMEWACADGLILGTNDGKLNPKGQATRAQVATVLMRLLESRS